MTANSKPKYQLWNEEEFLGDLYVRAMTPLQRWMYRTLLQASFFHSTRPYLPDDDNLLWMLAGCENKQQWLNNMDPVRAMFTPLEEAGVRLIGQKRVVSDWERLLDKRELHAELGRRGGEATAQAHAAAFASPKEVKEVEGEKEEKRRPLLAKSSAPDSQLEAIANEVFGHCDVRSLFRKPLAALVRQHGLEEVVGAFRTWSAAVPNPAAIRRPVTAFLRVAENLLGGGASGPRPAGAILPSVSPDVVRKVNDEIALISDNDVVFNATQSTLVAMLIAEYGPEDVLEGFRDFYGRIDSDFDRRFAAKTFSETGGQYIRTIRTRREQQAGQEQLLETLKQRGASQAEVDLAEARAAEAEEESLIEPELV